MGYETDIFFINVVCSFYPSPDFTKLVIWFKKLCSTLNVNSSCGLPWWGVVCWAELPAVTAFQVGREASVVPSRLFWGHGCGRTWNAPLCRSPGSAHPSCLSPPTEGDMRTEGSHCASGAAPVLAPVAETPADVRTKVEVFFSLYFSYTKVLRISNVLLVDCKSPF